MTLSLKQIKLDEIDERVKLSVFGFVRDSQKLLPDYIPTFYNIPSLIIHIILAFYYETDFFYKYPSNIEVSSDKKQFKVKSNDIYQWVNIFGKIGINSLSHVRCFWKIKTIKSISNMFIGIVSHRNLERPYQYWYSQQFYTLFNGGQIRGQLDGKTYNEEMYGSGYGKDDIVTMYLDMENKELSFDINDNKYGVAVSKIKCGKNITYYLGISVIDADHEMCIVDFGYY